jgi:hypothetical protein
VKSEATPHSPASFVNSLAGAPGPRTLAYDWFSNAITITWLHAGTVGVRPQGEAAAPADVLPVVAGTRTAIASALASAIAVPLRGFVTATSMRAPGAVGETLGGNIEFWSAAP